MEVKLYNINAEQGRKNSYESGQVISMNYLNVIGSYVSNKFSTSFICCQNTIIYSFQELDEVSISKKFFNFSLIWMVG